jgi:hypothetical protein
VFDIEGEMSEFRTRIHRIVENYPAPGKHGDWQITLNKLVFSSFVNTLVYFGVFFPSVHL